MNKKFLKGKKIGITALDLEQAEHRGIAAVTKSLIQSLKNYGAEIYLITSFGAKRAGIFKIGFKEGKLLEEIYISDIFSSLQEGVSFREKFSTDIFYKIQKIFILTAKFPKLLFSNFKVSYKIFKINQSHKSNNIYDSRMEYINNINGFIMAKNVFDFCRLRSMRFLPKAPSIPIKKSELDLIITSSPLSISNRSKKNTNIIQIVHDAIPIQVSNHPENPLIYFNRIKDAHINSSCLYVSAESKRIVRNILGIKNIEDNNENVLYPLPSLTSEILEEAKNIKNVRGIDKPYILFNSSIVNRKRVENAISLFNKSDLEKNNFILCIAGKLHKTKYSEFIKELCKNNKSILLLDYVNELEKAWLFLNASLLISTSSTEGFGVPILDALSINLPCLATDIPTYQEIKAFKNDSNLTLLKQNQDVAWIKNLNKVNKFSIEDTQKRLDRINHFKNFFTELEKNTILKINSFMN